MRHIPLQPRRPPSHERTPQCIAKKENYTLLPEAADRIVEFSEGDLRHAINALQTASAYKEGVIDEKTVSLVIGEASPSKCRK